MVYEYSNVTVNIGSFDKFDILSLPNTSTVALFLNFRDSMTFKSHQEDIFAESHRVLVDGGELFVGAKEGSLEDIKVGSIELGMKFEGVHFGNDGTYAKYTKEEV